MPMFESNEINDIVLMAQRFQTELANSEAEVRAQRSRRAWGNRKWRQSESWQRTAQKYEASTSGCEGASPRRLPRRS